MIFKQRKIGRFFISNTQKYTLPIKAFKRIKNLRPSRNDNTRKGKRPYLQSRSWLRSRFRAFSEGINIVITLFLIGKPTMVIGNPYRSVSNHDNACNRVRRSPCPSVCCDEPNPVIIADLPKGDFMTDENKAPETDKILTPTDARLDAIQAQMDSMKADYEQQLKTYQDANKQLFAMLNKPSVPTPEPMTAKAPGFDFDKAESAFMRKYTKRSD